MLRHRLMLAKDAEPFPGYRLHEFIGSGAYGEVWSATAPNGNPVALKFMPFGHNKNVSREIRAVQSVRSLEHPNLININRVWADSRFLVIDMELAEANLSDLFNVYWEESGCPIPRDHVCHYLRQIASGLDFLNKRQHVLRGQRVALRHCDVKPSNMLIMGEKVKLADFSFTVQVCSTRGSCPRVGTLDYAGPEIFQGMLSDRSDQFSLAVSYCQLRSGEFPFPFPPHGFDKDYVRPDPDLSMLDEAEKPIVGRALNAVPQDRFPSCTEFMNQLKSLCNR